MMQRRLSGDTSRRLSGDSGYVVALTALLLVPLMAFTSLAVDVGAWYARAAEIQQTGDAAALSGVWKLPEGLGVATTAACETIRKNGFANVAGACGGSSTTLSATITDVSDLTYKLKVDINDTRANQYFSRLFKPGGVQVNRAAVGQFVPATKMGSARNFLGTGSLTMRNGQAPENFWLAISGPCASKEQGDRINTKSDANYNSSGSFQGSGAWNRCTGSDAQGTTVTNPEYDNRGYLYGISFSQDMPGVTYVPEIYNGNWCTGAPTSDGSGGGSNAGGWTARVRSNNSPLDPFSASQIGTDQSLTSCGWADLPQIANPTKGTYFIQISSGGHGTTGTTQHGSNAFGLRVRQGTGAWSTSTSGGSACTSDSTDAGYPFSATCPNVFGYKDMGVYANAPGGGQQAAFFLANVGTENNGKVMQIDLWDPGEGARALQILNPTGTPHAFTWQVMCWDPTQVTCTDQPPFGGRGPTAAGTVNVTIGGTATALANALELCGTPNPGCDGNDQPGFYRGSRSKYSDRLVRLLVTLPPDLTTVGPGTWWKIQYTSNTAPTDRTTWSVSMRGSPVRLVPN